MASKHFDFVNLVKDNLTQEGYTIIDTEFIVEDMILNGSKVKIDILVEKDNRLIPVECGKLGVPRMERRFLLEQKYGMLLHIPYGNFKDKRQEYIRFNSVMVKCTKDGCPKNIDGWDYTGYKEYPGMTTCPYCKTQVRLPKNEEKL